MAEKKKGKPGQKPKLELTKEIEDRIRVCAEAMMPFDEIAARLGVARRTFFKFRKDNPAVQDIIDMAQDRTKGSIRMAQLKLALSGDKTMLIFLGKVLLDQKEKVALVGAGGGPVETATFSAKELAEMSDDEIDRARSQLRKLNADPEEDSGGAA